MIEKRKACSLALIVALAASALIAFEPTSASFTPAIPQFTLVIVNHTYDEPTTYTTDQFTGVTTAHGGTHYEWKTLDLTITNQPTESYGGDTLYYNIRFKGQYTDRWTEHNGEGESYRNQNSSGVTTIVSYFLEGYDPGFSVTSSAFAHLSNGTKLSFQVQALWANYEYDFTGGLRSFYFDVSSSSTSDIQTITLGSGEVTVEQGTASVTTPAPRITAEPTFNPTANPTNNSTIAHVTPQDYANTQQGSWPTLSLEQTVIAVMATVIAILAVGMIVLKRRQHGK